MSESLTSGERSSMCKGVLGDDKNLRVKSLEDRVGWGKEGGK